MIFFDPNTNEQLTHIEIDDLFQGQSSRIIPIGFKNEQVVPVYHIEIISSSNPGISLLKSEVEEFDGVSILEYEDVYQPQEEDIFYIRLDTDLDTTPAEDNIELHIKAYEYIE